MKKLHSFLACAFVACLTLVLFSSCEEGVKGFAPKSVEGKTFWTPSLPTDNAKVSFNTSSTFSLPGHNWGAQHQKLLSTSYSYRKTGDNTAELTLEWTTEGVGNTGYMSEWNGEIFEWGPYHWTLHFTSPEAGYIGGSYQDFTLY